MKSDGRQSKLFNPTVSDHWRSPALSKPDATMFVNPPFHADIPLFDGPTDTGKPWYPLKLNGTPIITKKVEKRPISLEPQETFRK